MFIWPPPPTMKWHKLMLHGVSTGQLTYTVAEMIGQKYIFKATNQRCVVKAIILTVIDIYLTFDSSEFEQILSVFGIRLTGF